MDRYGSYAELAADEQEGRDYRIVAIVRASPVVVLAPHGGSIEPTTSQIAAAIAGDDHSLYCFEGLDAGRPHGDLHITSDCFDEPQALRLVADARFAVAVHGRLNRNDPTTTWLGGLDTELATLAAAELSAVSFPCLSDGAALSGRSPTNICNRTASRRGLQLELPRDLRDALRDDADLMQRFAEAVRTAIARRYSTNAEISSARADMR